MRSKEEAHDYRYFPDPDLLPLELTQAYVDGLKDGLPELPDAKKAALHARLQAFPPTTRTCWWRSARAPTSSRQSVKERRELGCRHRATSQLGHQRAARAPEQRTGSTYASQARLSPAPTRRGHHRSCIASGAISGKIAKDLFEIVWSEGGDPAEIVEKRGLQQVTDTGAIETAVDAVIAANPDKVAAVKAKPAMLGWFVGQVMKSTGGKANPQAVNELLKKKLGL